MMIYIHSRSNKNDQPNTQSGKRAIQWKLGRCFIEVEEKRLKLAYHSSVLSLELFKTTNI